MDIYFQPFSAMTAKAFNTEENMISGGYVEVAIAYMFYFSVSYFIVIYTFP